MTRSNSEEQQAKGERNKRNSPDADDEEDGEEDGDHEDEDVNVSSGDGGTRGEQPYVEQQQPGSNDSSASNKPKRNPFCSRCRNHGKSAQVKGHKRHCEYRDCQCEGCKLVECRQIVSAAQIKRRRYQKQDEECGRRIEISPPVLKSESNSDPAAIIAKTLIGYKSQQQQHQPLSLQQAPPLMGPKRHFDITIDQPNHRQLFCPIPMQPATTATTTTASAVTSSAHSCHSQQQFAANAALGNAFHLFQLPNSMLSPHNHHQPRQHQASQLPGSQHHHHQQPHRSTAPSASEQLNLIEEILNSFGPMAIYAWLRAENFDLQKIHSSIELVRPYYNNLVNLNLNLANKAAAAAAAAVATNAADLTTPNQHHSLSAAICGSSSPTTRTPADTGGSNSNCSSGSGGNVGSSRSGSGQIYDGEASTGPTPMTLNTTSCSTTTPNVTTDTNVNSHNPISAPNAAHLSLAATLNNLPMPTASSLLWSGFRSTTVDREDIRPLSFLPHFMHQHHQNLLNAAASQAHHHHHHHHHQSSQNQHTHQQVSPSSAHANLSTLASSSSTVL